MNMELKVTGNRQTDPLSTPTTNQVADPVYEQQSTRMIWNRMYAPVCWSHIRTDGQVPVHECSLMFRIYGNPCEVGVASCLANRLSRPVEMPESKRPSDHFFTQKMAKQIQFIKIPN